MSIDKPCHNSSCEPTATGRRSKKAHGLPMHTESLTTDLFFDLFFWCKGILNGFASVTACGCCNIDYPTSFPWESKCRTLARFVRFAISVRKKTFAYILSWTRDLSKTQWPKGSNLPNVPNIHFWVENKKIRPIRPIRVRKKHIRVWIILSWPQIYRIKRII